MDELMQIQPQYMLLWQQIGRTNFQRWAGVAGAIAIIFTVYIENIQLPNLDRHFIALANQINYIHALVLIAVPLTRRPNLTGFLFLVGMSTFCLGCYFCALTNFNGYIYMSSVGLVILMVAWLSLLF